MHLAVLARSASALAIVAVLVVACQPSPPLVAGAACESGTAQCTSQVTALFCAAGRIAPANCPGPRGCASDGVHVLCDQSEASPGDGCFVGGVSTAASGACGRDKRSLLRCARDHFELVEPCKGPKGCFFEGNFVRCDNTEAESGDPCLEGASCTLDHKARLRCDHGRFAVEDLCHGPKGCNITDTGVRCDNTNSEIGELCSGGIACTGDHATLLKCDAGKMVETRVCRGKAGCAIVDGAIRCDQSVAQVGDACEEGAACSVDMKSMLGCRDGKRVVEHVCPKACEIREKENLIGCK